MLVFKSFCPRCGNLRRDQSAIVFSAVRVWSKCQHCEWVWQSSLLQTVFDYAVSTAGLRNPSRKSTAAAAAAILAAPAAHAESMKEPHNDTNHVDVWAELEEMERGNVLEVSSDDVEIDELLDRIDGSAPVTASATPLAPIWADADDATVDAFCASLSHDSTRSLRPASREGAPVLEQADPAPAVRSVRLQPDPASDVTRPLFVSAPITVEPVRATLPEPVAPKVIDKVVEKVRETDGETVGETFERLERQFAGLETKRRVRPSRKKPVVEPVAPSVEDMTLAASAERMLKNVETLCETFERLDQQFAGLERSCSEMLA